MADFNSSLPVRTESVGDVDIFVSDSTTPSQKLKVNADGSIDTNFAAGSSVEITDGTETLLINVDGSLNAVVSATDLDIRNLTFATDKVDASGSTLGANDGVDIGDVTINNASLVVTATDLDIRNLTFATDKVDASGSTLGANDGVDIGDVTINNASLVVTATDLDIRNLSASQDNVAISDGTDTLAINTDGSLNVRISDRSGTEKLDYDTAAAVASAATDNHDYTTAATFRLTQVHVSASSRMKAEIQLETGAATNVFNTIAVAFTTESNLNHMIKFDSSPQVASGARVRIIRTNRDNQAQDLYSTIIGYDE